MPFYNSIDTAKNEGKRTVERLLKLKEGLSQIPSKTVDDTLLLATWNIRDFDKPAYGKRSDEAIFYIAEIISRFDLVAIQEVYKDLTGIKRVRRILGSHWKYVVTDVTEGRHGNKERMTFVYDSRKVTFGGLAGELVLPPVKVDGGDLVPADQVWRTPFVCGFRSGWSRFMLASVHILWGSGKSSKKKEPVGRVAEIRKVAQFLKKRTEDKTAWSQNLILVGDFNIFTTEGEAFGELLKAKFEIPDELKDFCTNAKQNRQYDQIAFRVQKDRLGTTGNANVFNFFDYVFREEDEHLYVKHMGDAYKKKKNGKVRNKKEKSMYYKTYWRTHQMSDHLPLWVELKIDYSRQYLNRKVSGDVKPSADPK
jgi:endonuclease/exonuclease/phosphatase family metal-dependent hydrolase